MTPQTRGTLKHSEILDPDWSRYPNTVLAFEAAGAGADEVCVDLRRPLDEAALRALTRLGLDDPFAVITAHDPHGENFDGEQNEKRAAGLEETLRSQGLVFHQVNACSPDAEHCEASVAVKMPLAAARQLAHDYGQVAFFWFDGQRFWIAGGIVETDPIALPRVP
ncbi:hypothetical protein BH23GEM2_BH23GEM2_26370 [soil metagenome]